MVTTERVLQRQAEDKAFIHNTDKWPMWPYLPIRRKVKDNSQCGFLFAKDKQWSKVYLENIFALQKMTIEERRKIRVIEYKSIEELLEDGWYID